MDIKEAILRLKDHFAVHDDGRPTPYLDEAVHIAIKALEKQIPKKPIAHYILVGDEEVIDSYTCKACGLEVGVNYFDGHRKREHHCECGQAIDWSEVDE